MPTRLPSSPCPYHGALEAELSGLRGEVRELSGRLWDVLERLADDRPSRLEVIRTARARPTTPPGGTPSLSPARRARVELGRWAATAALALGLGIGLGLGAGLLRGCGVQVPLPAAAAAVPSSVPP